MGDDELKRSERKPYKLFIIINNNTVFREQQKEVEEEGISLWVNHECSQKPAATPNRKTKKAFLTTPFGLTTSSAIYVDEELRYKK
jgi:hypothetical protein